MSALDADGAALEEYLTKVVCEILSRETINREEDFLSLGMRSLQAVMLVNRLREDIGIELPLMAFFEAPTVVELAEHVRKARISHLPPLTPAPRDGAMPLSFSQERLWFLEQLGQMGSSYHVPVVLRLRGKLDVDALRQAFTDLIARHESLRTRFVTHEGVGLQQIDPPWSLELPVRKLAEVDVEGWLQARIEQCFDLEREYLLRAELIETAADEHLLLIVQHHLITDGWSVGILLHEMRHAYQARCRGEVPRFTPLSIQYADWATWQRRSLDAATTESALGWWRQQLQGVPVSLELPTDAPRPAVQSFRGACVHFSVPRELSERLRQLGQSEGATLFMVLLSAWQIVLSRWSGQEDLMVGTPTAGRTHSQAEGLLGLFVNTLALRGDLRGVKSYRSYLRRVREMTLGAYAHQELPFERLVEALCPVRDLSRQPLFQVMFALQNAAAAVAARLQQPDQDTGLQLQWVELGQPHAKFDLTLNIEEEAQGLQARLEYASDLFERASIERLCGHVLNVLGAIVANPDQDLRRIELLSEAERHQQLHEWNVVPQGTGEDHLVSRLQAQVLRTGQAVAVDYLGQRLSYAQLDMRAECLARQLRARGLRREEIVGIHAERSLHLLPGMIGILKAGGVILPIDPHYPPARQHYMLRDAGVRWLLSDCSDLALEADAPGIERLDLASLLLDESRDIVAQAVEPILPDQLAYVIYTSGSTGQPKGAALTHRGALNLYDWYQQRYELQDSRRVLVISSFSFDLTLKNAFAPLLAGGTVVLGEAGLQDGDRLLQQLQDHDIHLLNCAPAQYYLILESLRQQRRQDTQVSLPESLRYVVLGGEALRNDRLLAAAEDGNPHARTINSYGPTEATDVIADGEVPTPGAPGLYTVLGQGVRNSRLYVLDRHAQLIPAGATGELHIGGPALARGYLGRPGLTAERFIPDPFNPGQRLYCTGDRVRWRGNGQLDYVGRIDQQIKLRGLRVELGEIESQLLRQPGVRDAAVKVHEHNGQAQLIAYLIGAEQLAPREVLDRALRAQLPNYMVPNRWVWLERFPLTPSGKLDRHALPIPSAGNEITLDEDQTPRGDTEQLIAELFTELLGLKQVGRLANFFELGGHSLMAMRLVNRLYQDLAVRIPVQTVFATATVAALARRVEEELAGQIDEMSEQDVERELCALQESALQERAL